MVSIVLEAEGAGIKEDPVMMHPGRGGGGGGTYLYSTLDSSLPEGIGVGTWALGKERRIK